HLLGEATGLFIAAQTWPCWPRSADWYQRGRAIIEREALLQTAPDGVNREQALSYQQWVVDLLLFVGLAARAAGTDFSPPYWQRIESMLEYIASVMDVAGNVPMIGDSDDARVAGLVPSSDDSSPFASLLATGAVLFGRSDFKAKA